MMRSPRLDRVAHPRFGPFSGVPMASSMSRARLGAPPWRGPDSAPIAPQTAAARSAPVEVITRAVKVDELKPWSIVKMRYCSMRPGLVSRRARPRSASTGSWRRSRGRIGAQSPPAPAESVGGGQDGGNHGAQPEGLVGSWPGSTSRVGGQSSSAPSTETAVRRTSSGWPRPARAGSSAASPGGMRPERRRAPRRTRPTARGVGKRALEPSGTRRPRSDRWAASSTAEYCR